MPRRCWHAQERSCRIDQRHGNRAGGDHVSTTTPTPISIRRASGAPTIRPTHLPRNLKDTRPLESRGPHPAALTKATILPADVGKAYQTNPFANGLLAKDQYANYNFHAGNLVQFEVYPNNPLYGTSSVFTSSSPAQFAWVPPVGSSNGFWLLTLDRVTLLPIDLNQGDTSCNLQAVVCGQFFQTGTTDFDKNAAKAASDLGFKRFQNPRTVN